LNTPALRLVSSQNLRVNADVLWQRLDDEVIVMQLKTDHIYSLNHTGARFWELLVAGQDLPSIQVELANEFHITSEMLAAEIEKTLALLISEQLLIAREP
jgi:hypothetical protein